MLPTNALSNEQWDSNEDEVNIYSDFLCIISQASGFDGWTKKLIDNKQVWINPLFFFFHFLPSKTINWKWGWSEQNILSLGYLMPL